MVKHTATSAHTSVLFVALVVLLGLLSLFLGLVSLFLSPALLSSYLGISSLSEQSTHQILHAQITFFVLFIASLFLLILVLWKRKKSAQWAQRKKDLIVNILLLFAVLVLFALLCELALRAFMPLDVKYDLPAGFSSFDEKYVSLNAEGWRDAQHKKSTPQGVTRILVLGDSFTFGHGVKNASLIYAKQLEQMLNSDPRYAKKGGIAQINEQSATYEVVVMGARGANTLDELNTLKEEGLSYAPDIIILGYVLNDFINSDPRIKSPKPNFYLYWGSKYLEQKSYLYAILHKGHLSLLESLGLRESYYSQITNAFNSPINQEENMRLLGEMGTLSKENNATLVIAIFPFFHSLDGYAFTDMHEYLKTAALSQGIIAIDLLPSYAHHNESDLIVSPRDRHPNAKAHEIAAEELAQGLFSRGII